MPKSSEQAVAADTPAPSTPEPSGRQILEQAKADLKNLDRSEPAPAEDKAPEPAAPSPEPTQAPKEEDEGSKTPKGSRREEGQRLREQIRKEVQAELQAEQQAAERRRQSEQQQQEFDALVAKADAGDWEAKDRVLQILKGNRGMAAAIQQGRTAVIEEIGREITQAIYKLDGADEEAQTALMQAPSVMDFGKTAFEHGRRIERAIHEDTIATLKAENESLKGRLAGSSPSPVATNGTAPSRGENGRFKSMHDAYLAAAADLGYRPKE
jgi:hypothetical protein